MTATLRCRIRTASLVAAGAVLAMVATSTGALAYPITFLTARPSGLSSSDFARAAGDLDGDGDVDVAGTDNSVFVSYNTGGTFGAKVIVASGETYRCVAVGDLNGDGRADVVASGPSLSGGRVAILLSTGPGFAAPVFVATDSAGIVDVQLGDLDGDGDRDLVAVNQTTRRVSRLLNDGTGTFSGLVSTFWPSAVSRMWIADLNGDTKLDLLSGNWPQFISPSTPDSSRAMFSLGGGAFSAPQSTGLGLARAFADFDGDGRLDAFVYVSSSALGIARGRSDGTFDPPVATAFGLCFEAFATPFDLDHDARQELAIDDGGGCTPSRFGVYSVDAALHLVSRAEMFGVVSPSTLALDADGDGWSDLVTSTTIYPNSGARLGGTRMAWRYDMVGGDYQDVLDVDAADLTGDGANDLVVSSRFYTGGLFPNAGNALFPVGGPIQPQSYIRNTVLVDLDGDGDRDALMLHRDPGLTQHVYAWLNDGAGHQAGTTTTTLPHVSESPYNPGNYAGLVVADFDGDGDMDGLTVEASTHTPWLVLNDGAAHFTPQPCALPLDGMYADLDGDGLPERLSASGDSVAVEFGTGVGTLGAPTRAYAGGTVNGAGFGDVNGDGIPDVVCLLASGTIATRLGAPGGAWGALVLSGVPAAPPGLTPTFGGLGDLDGDGALDALVTASPGSVICAHRNLGGAHFGDRGDSVSPQAFGTLMADLDGDHAAELIGVEPLQRPGSGFTHAINILLNAGPAGGATPVLVSTVSAQAFPDHARLTWQLGGTAVASVRLERRVPAGGWTALATLSPDGLSRVTYEDFAVAPGGRYGYRLIADGSPAGETWVTLPARAALAIQRVWPNPVVNGALRVRFTVDRAAPVEIALLDVAGRRVAGESLATPVVGASEIEIGGARQLNPGLYFLRLSQSGRQAHTKVVVTR